MTDQVEGGCCGITHKPFSGLGSCMVGQPVCSPFYSPPRWAFLYCPGEFTPCISEQRRDHSFPCQGQLYCVAKVWLTGHCSQVKQLMRGRAISLVLLTSGPALPTMEGLARQGQSLPSFCPQGQLFQLADRHSSWSTITVLY